MKQSVLFLILLLAGISELSAQTLQLNLIMNPRPSPYLSDWQERSETVMLNIFNPSTSPVLARLDVRILRDGQLKAASDFNKMPILQVLPGGTTVNAQQVILLEAMSFFGEDKNIALRTGKLPSSMYQLCVQLVNAENAQPISQQVCKGFEVVSYQLPYLLQPANGSTYTCQQIPTIVFRWSPVTPVFTSGINYHLALFEVLPGQTPMNAFRTNRPILERDIFNQTQLVFPSDIDLTLFQPQPSTTVRTQTKIYVWSVRTTDLAGRPITDNDGWSEPATFTVSCTTAGTSTTDSVKCVCKGELLGIGYAPDNDMSKEYVGGPYFLPEGNISNSCTYNSSISFWLRFRINCVMPCLPRIVGKWTIITVDDKGNTNSTTQEGGIGLTLTPPASGTITVSFNGTMYCGDAACSPVSATRTISVQKGSSGSGTTTTDDGTGKPGTTTTSGGTTTTPGGGTTERPPTTTTREKCKCECWVKYDIEEVESKDGVTIYKAVVDGGCKPKPCNGSILPCTHKISYEWSFGSGDGAAEMTGDPKSEKVKVRCIKPGWYSLSLSGQVVCSDGTKCPFYANLEIPCPGEDSLPKTCVPPSLRSLPATPISLGSKIDKADEFPYPRALPIRASAIDMDMAIIECNPCLEGAKSTMKIPVRDGVTYSWVLDGKGTLNTMPSILKAKAIEKEIEELLRKIAEIQSRIDSLEREKKELPLQIEAQKKETEAILKNLTAIIDSVDKRITTLKESISKGERAIDDMEKSFALVSKTITEKNEESLAIQKAMDSLDLILAGKPSPEEVAKLKEISTQQTVTSAAEKSRDADAKKLSDRTAELAKTLADLLKEYKAAQVAYESLRTSSSGDAKSIGSYQTTMYPSGAPRDFFKAQRDFSDKATLWISSYAAGNASMKAELKAVNELADSALAATTLPLRTSLGALFSSKLSTLLSSMSLACGGIADKPSRDACYSALSTVSSAKSLYASNHATVLISGFKLDKSLKAKITAARAKISEREAALKSAETTLKAKAEGYAVAIESNKMELATLSETASSSAKKYEEEADKLGVLQAELKALELKRQEALDKIRIALFNERNSFADKKRSTDSLVRLLKDSLVTLSDSILARKAIVNVAKQDIETQEKEKEALLAQKTALEAILKIDVATIIKTIEGKIADAKKELDEWKKKLEEKRKDKDKALIGNKIAEGELVYYVPPPIEVLMDAEQHKRFDELKDSVTAAETALNLALAKKQALQKQLVMLLERIAREALRYREANDAATAAGEELDSLKRESSHLKNEGKKQQADEQLKAQNAVKDAEDDAEECEKKVKFYQDKVDKVVKDIAAQEKVVESAKEEATAAGKKALDLKAGLDKEKDLETKAKQTLAERTAELDKAKEEYKEKHGASGRAQSQRNHAIAANNQAAAVSARSEADKADADEKVAKTKVSSAESAVKSASESVKSATLRVVAATKSYDDARKEFAAKSQARIAAIDALNELNRRLEKDLGPRLQDAKNKLAEAKEEVEQREEERAALNENINKGLDSLDAVKEISESIAEAETTKKKAEAVSKEAAATVRAALSERDSLIKAANDSLKATRERLAQAKKTLHDFLFDIFDNPKLKDKITITANDIVLDAWRAGDDEKTEIKYISYSKRTPLFENTEPTGGLAGDKVQGECPVTNAFVPNGAIIATDPSLLLTEPRTIALMYKDGEPLWKEWAVIPEAEPILARDYSFLQAIGTDADGSRRICGPSVTGCAAIPRGSGVVDPVDYSWALDGASVLGTSHAHVAWKASEVPKPQCKKSVEHTVTYTASSIAADAPVFKKMMPEVKAGVLIEVTKKLVGAPNTTDTIVARVACGDHKGLAGEDIEISVKPKAEYAKLVKDYGLEKANQTTLVRPTDADGYVRIPFLYGSGVGEFDIRVEWKREGCKKDSLVATMPLYLQFLRFAESAPDAAMTAAKSIWEGKQSLEDAAKALPERKEDDDEDPNYKKITHAIVGVTDNEREPVNGISIEFLKHPKNKKALVYTPPKVPTELFGIARTLVSNLPKDEKEEVWVKACCEDAAVRKLCKPDTVEGKKSGKVNRFKIGNEKLPFIVELDAAAGTGERIDGSGKLIIEGKEKYHEFLQSFIDIPLKVNGVFLQEAGEIPVAKDGFVSWVPGEGKEISYKNFHFRVDSLSITAAKGAMIGGRISQEKFIPEGAGFHAELETSGNFFGTVSDLPEISFAKCTLKKGFSFTLDMHQSRDEADLFDELKPFVGIVINKAELVLPKTFSTNDGKDTVDSELSVENFAVGRKYDAGTVAIGGKVKISGKFFSMGFGGWKCSVSSLDFSFANSEIKEGKVSGSVLMPIPFEGELDIEISGSKEEWSGSISTKNPVAVPKIKTVFTLLEGTKISYKPATSLATLSINATATCEYFKRLDITNLQLDNTGKILGEVSITEPNIKFGRGFDLAISKLTIKKAEGEDLNISIKGSFSIPKIIALKGGVELTTGPSVKVSLDEAKIQFEYGPCSFDGSFAFSETEFRGEFDIGLKNLCNGGIGGKLIAGIQKVDEAKSFTYWYGELSAKVAIGPLGQTGLFITELGGGIGYNYEPPIGTQSGNPKELPNSLAFKAIVGIGTPASGALLNSRVEMVLIPWTEFSIYGKIWVLNKKESLFGEGKLTLSTEPAKLDGFVRMFIGIPDAEGKILSFDGTIGFMYSSAKKYIKSEKLSGVALQVIKAEGTVDITEDYIYLDGSLRYDFDKKIALGVVDFYVSLHAYAGGKFSYTNASSTLSAEAEFKGSVDVKGDFPLFGMSTLVTGAASVKAKLRATPSSVKVEAAVHVSYSVFGYSDSLDIDVGYSS